MTSAPWLSWTVRVAALLFALAYLPLALVWAYWIAAIGSVLPLAALFLLRAIARREERDGEKPSAGLRRLHRAATIVCWAGWVIAFVALVITLAFG